MSSTINAEDTRVADPVTASLDELQNEVRESMLRHRRHAGADGVFYNGGTVLTVILTGVATFLAPALPEGYVWVVAVLTGLATIVIVIQRTLSFGERWAFHTRMASNYDSIIQKIRRYKANVPSNGQKALDDIYRDYEAVKGREGELPGLGGIQQVGSGSTL